MESASIREFAKAHNHSMIHEALEKVIRGEDLSRLETCAVMEEFYSGQVTPSQMAALWTALSMKGMTTEERAAVDEARREHGPTTKPAGRDVLKDTSSGIRNSAQGW